jgi:hypothetical protein
MKDILQKVASLCKDNERTLLEKYDLIDKDSPRGKDCNGLFMEKTTCEGDKLLALLLWNEKRPEIIEMLKKMSAKDASKARKRIKEAFLDNLKVKDDEEILGMDDELKAEQELTSEGEVKDEE